jgi:hypothetical protein
MNVIAVGECDRKRKKQLNIIVPFTCKEHDYIYRDLWIIRFCGGSVDWMCLTAMRDSGLGRLMGAGKAALGNPHDLHIQNLLRS